MDEQLVELLDYQGVLGAVASTPDGLVVASAGVVEEDAESVAAAGSALAATFGDRAEPNVSLELDGGRLHLRLGDELMLVLLTEADSPAEAVGEVLVDALRQLESAVAGD